MKYDLEIVMSVCSKFGHRIEDFKKYGLVNIKNRKIKLNLLTTNEIIEDLEKNWHEQITVEVVNLPHECYTKTFHSYILNYDFENMESKWLMKIDDDSCTDIDGLLSNLEEFYDHKEPFYLAASCSRFKEMGINGRENWIFGKYIENFGKYKKIAYNLKHEVECCIVSQTAVKKILQNNESKSLLSKRSSIEGGCIDCVFAFASALAKVYPIDCPFITHFPTLEKFSLFNNGIKNHIHLICRNSSGENFNEHERKSGLLYSVLTKIIDKYFTDTEKQLINKKYLLETDKFIKIYEFKNNFLLKIKLEENNFMWLEQDGMVYIIDRNKILHTLKLEENGDLVGDSCRFVLIK